MRRMPVSIDWELFAPAFVLVIISLTVLASINIDIFKSQLIFSVLSFFLFVFFSQLALDSIQRYRFPIYAGSIFLFLIVFFAGFESRGAIRWLDVFGLRVQFSEILKPFLALSLASFLAKTDRSAGSLLKSLLFLFPVIFLIYIQPDLGNAVIYLFATIATLLVAGFPLLWFVGGFLSTVVTFPVFWHFLRDYQKQRVMTFLYPSKDPLGSSYNVAQSIIAVGSGQFFGKGLSDSTQSGLRFLPERHTDFIFATLSEELGFVGGMLVLIAFGFLLYKIYVIFSNANDTFSKLFAACAFCLLLLQFFINIGMNIGMLPIVGVTLPFMSYGGSSLLSNFILLGIVSSISIRIRNSNVLEIR